MKQILLTIGFLSSVGLSTACASSVTWSGSPSNRTVVDSALLQVSSGSLVWAGTFSNDTAYTFNPTLSIATNVSNFTTQDGWKQFTLDPATGLADIPLAVTNNLGISVSGRVSGTVTDNNGLVGSGLQASFFDNKPIYLWIFNSTTVGGSTQMGI